MIPILPGILPAFLILTPLAHAPAHSTGSHPSHSATSSAQHHRNRDQVRASIAGKRSRERAARVRANETLYSAHHRKSCKQLGQIWLNAGGSRATEQIAEAEGEAESAGRPWATDLNGGASTDKGLWQINDLYHPAQSTYDIRGNARAAVAISNGGTSWVLWSSYVAGTEHGQCGYP